MNKSGRARGRGGYRGQGQTNSTSNSSSSCSNNRKKEENNIRKKSERLFGDGDNLVAAVAAAAAAAAAVNNEVEDAKEEVEKKQQPQDQQQPLYYYNHHHYPYELKDQQELQEFSSFGDCNNNIMYESVEGNGGGGGGAVGGGGGTGQYGSLGVSSPPSFCPTIPKLYTEEQFAEAERNVIKAKVEKNGYISLQLRYDVLVDIAPNKAVRLTNKRQSISLSLTGCGTQMAMVHPKGRVYQYNSRVEMQTTDYCSIKNAKMWPKGVSFTATNCALVYLVDQAGARTTMDTFFDLYANNIADSIFMTSCTLSANHVTDAIQRSIDELQKAEYWQFRNETDCWEINGVIIKQTEDGLTTVERKYGEEEFILKTSPSNGKARLQSSFLYVTASLGEEAHIFVKSQDRRLHYNGQSFQIRNGGHSAGFDETGSLRIW